MKQPKIITMYEADDGTQFESAFECIAYEQTLRVGKFLDDNRDKILVFNEDTQSSTICEHRLVKFIIDNIHSLAEAVDPDIFEK